MQLKITLSNKKIEYKTKILVFSSENLQQNLLNIFKNEKYILENNLFKAGENEVFILQKNEIIYFLLGVGTKKDFASYQKIANKFIFDFQEKLINDTEIIFNDKVENQIKKGFLLGILLGTYKINSTLEYKKIAVYSSNIEENTLKEITILAESQKKSMDLLNLPANKKNSEIIGKYAENLAKDLNISCSIFNKEKCLELGLNAYLAVNRASNFEPNFIILEYKSPNATKTLGLVGKCVTFDTGGISIKPSTNMHEMKSDLGGAIAVFGAFETIVKLKLDINIIAIIPSTDNVVDKNSYLPSEIITAYNGKTIEIIDTDAEGRLVLADALAYLTKNYSTDVIIDLATLTGSTIRMFGYECASFFATDNQTKNMLESVGNQVGERLWNLPLWDEFSKDLKSDMADLKNYTGKSYSDAIYAAKFLQEFTNSHQNWVHIDIAGVAFTNNHYAKDKSATGYGIQLLVEFAKKLINI